MRMAALAIAAAVSLPATAATVYKWVDEQGVTHYEQGPPPHGTTADRIELRGGRAPKPSASATPAPPVPPAPARAGEARRAAKKRPKIPPEVAAENCRRARLNRARLANLATRRFRLPDGRVVTLTDEERQRRIEAAEARIRKYCAGS